LRQRKKNHGGALRASLEQGEVAVQPLEAFGLPEGRPIRSGTEQPARSRTGPLSDALWERSMADLLSPRAGLL